MDFIYNDGGRAVAGFKGDAGDCVTRAIAIATQLPYADVYSALGEINASARSRKRGKKRVRSARNGIPTRSAGFKQFMQSLGWRWTPTMFIGSGCKVHLRDGELPMGRLVVAVSKHYVAVLDGVVHDNHDPQRDTGRCVYGYWVKV